MAATAGLSLTLDPMGKMCQNASSLKPLQGSRIPISRHPWAWKVNFDDGKVHIQGLIVRGKVKK